MFGTWRVWSWLASALFALLAILLTPWQAAADTIEVSAGFSFDKTTYSDENFSWTRRWGTSVGYYFNDKAELEFAFQDVVYRTHIVGFEDTNFHDQIYSANWVQSLWGKNHPIQPYFKAGIGQLNRDAGGTYANGVAPASKVDSLTVIAGAGLRLYLTRRFAIRTEATSYLSGGSIKSWSDNFAVNFGLSWFF
jgi:hypothetical protein